MPPPRQQQREPIPVKVLRFEHGQNVEIPGKPGAVHVTSETAGGKTWTVEYEPWARHHRVTFREGAKVRIVHNPESWCMWEEP